jgi:hypothetical protein
MLDNLPLVSTKDYAIFCFVVICIAIGNIIFIALSTREKDLDDDE